MTDDDGRVDDDALAEADVSVPDPFAGPDWASKAERSQVRTSPDQVRRRIRSRRRRRRRRLWLAAALLGFCFLAAIAWLAYTGLKARTELQAVRSEVAQLRSQIAAGDLDGARATAGQLRQHAVRAHDLTTGPIWATASAVPYLGAPLDTARVVSDSVARIATSALPPLVEASSNLDPKSLRRADGSFDLAPLQRTAPLLAHSVDTMSSAIGALNASSGSTWLGAVNDARAQLVDRLTPLYSTLENAEVAAHTVPSLLGADGPKRYIVTFQNEAEVRGLGGLPGAFAVLEADHGTLRFVRFESDTYLVNVPSGVEFGPDYDGLYSSTPDATTNYVDSDLSPHYPYAAQIWLGEWEHKTGEQLDGAITLDPTAISYLLAVTGPATMPDGSKVTAGNVVSLTQQRAYDRFGFRTGARKKYLLRVARAVSKALINSDADMAGLVRAAARAAGEHRLLVWTRDDEIEQRLAPTPIAGQVPQTTEPYIGLALNNGGATKLDYYLHTRLNWVSSGCGSTRDVTVTLILRNDPPDGLTKYVYGFTGRPGFPSTPGVNRTLLTYFATSDAHFTGVTLNGKPYTASSGLERGHPAFGMLLDLPVGVDQTIVFHLKERAGSTAPITRIQPMVNPVELTVKDNPCDS